MSRERIELSLEPETVKLLRTVAIKKYGNMRSVSRLIEDLTIAMCPECGDIQIQEMPNIDPEAAKANREEYCLKFMEEQDHPICWPCGRGWMQVFVCKACQCEFNIPIPDAKYCPACGSTDIVPWDLDPKHKSIDDRIDELDHEKFKASGWDHYRKQSGRYNRRKDISEMNLKELQNVVDNAISRRDELVKLNH